MFIQIPCSTDFRNCPGILFRNPFTRRSFHILQRPEIFLSCPDLHDLLHTVYEDLAVADMPGVQGFLDCLYDRADRDLADDDLYLDLRDQVLTTTSTLTFGIRVASISTPLYLSPPPF